MFTNGDAFDNDAAGGTAIVPGIGTLTTISVLPDGAVNTTSGALGINATGGGDAADAFDNAESWSFRWDTNTTFDAIDFSSFSTATETFTLQSSAFQGIALTPGDSDIAFDSSTGTFTFSSGDSTDNFNLNDLSGGVQLNVSASVALTLSFQGAAADFGRLQSFSFTAVPEPSACLLCLLGLPVTLQRRRVR